MQATHGRSCGVNTFATMALTLVHAILHCTDQSFVNGFCHGDDFVTAAAEDQIEVFGKKLQEKI